MTRIALGIEYNGTNYNGWQKQSNVATIQACVEAAIAKVAAHKVQVFCAGRTDTGVHAKGQVIHFDTTSQRNLNAWILGVNSNLAHDISIKWVKEVDNDFHARFSAIARSYRYLIYNAKTNSAIFNNLVAWYYQGLDEKRMQEAGQYLIGEHDFSSFRGCGCQAKTPIRKVHALQVRRQGKLIIIDINANAFLHHMVRNIAGLLMAIGAGKREPIWAEEVLQACDRTVAGKTAPACGLYLTKVYYEAIRLNLPAG